MVEALTQIVFTRKEVFDPSTHSVLSQNPAEVFGEEFSKFEVPITRSKTTLGERVRDLVLYNYPIKKAIFELTRSRLIRSNPLYHRLYRFHMLRVMKELEKKPNVMSIENTTYCNQACIFCPHPIMERTAGIMNLELYKKIIDDAAELGVQTIGIVGLGEPLLDKFIAERIRYAKFMGIQYVFTVSNLVALTPKMAEALVKSGLDHIGVSIDAADAETYKHIHRSNYDVVKRNVMLMQETKKRLGSRKPIVEVRFRHQQANYYQINDFTAQFKPYADHVVIYCMIHNWAGAVDNSPMSNYARMDIRKPCKNLWNAFYVCWDGRVAFCCLDSECKLPLGDMRKQSIQDVWQGNILKNVRKIHLQGLYQKLPTCTDCTENEYYMQPWY